MARMTKKEREALQEARRSAALWSAWNAALDEEHGSSGVMYLDDIVPDTPPEEPSPFEETSSGFRWPTREEMLVRSPLNPFGPLASREGLDVALGVGAGLTDIGGVLVDTVAPDAHPLSMGEEGYADGMTPGLYARSAAQNIADTALRLPSAAMGIAEWLGLDSHGALMPLAAADARLTPVADERGRRAEAIDAQRRAAGLPDSQELRESVSLNRLADALYGGAEAVRGAQSAELQAAQQGLGEAVQGGVGDTARFLASGPGMRALVTGVLPESAAYAVPQMGAARLARLGGAGTGLSQTAANMGTAYTVAQQNARDVEGQILGLSPEEAMTVPEIAAEFANTGDIDSAKRIVANRARHETLAASVPAAPLYALDTFSRIGAGVRSGRTATLQRQVGYGVLRESAGEFGQEAAEAIAADLGLARAGLIDRDEVGATAPAAGMLGAIASAPIAGGASYAQARTDFSNRADRLEESVARLREVEELMRADRPVSDSVAPSVTEAPSSADSTLSEELRQAEEDAAWEQRAGERERETNWENQRVSLERRVDSARENAEALQDRVDAGDTSQATLNSLTEALREERTASELLQTHMERDPSLQPSEMSPAAEPYISPEEQARITAEEDARVLAEEERAFALREASEFDRQEQEKGDAAARKRLANAKGARTRQRRAHLAGVREANMHLDADARAEVLADAMVEWDAANPEPTLETLPAEAPRGARQSRQTVPPNVYGRAPRPGARPAPEAAPEASVEPTEEVDPAVETDRASALEELRARYRREQRGSGEPAGKKASEVVQELADRVRRGTNRRALEVDALLTDGKLTIVDPEIMATVDGATASTEGFYDGERMYINAAALPEGDPVGVLLDSVLAHEANHAATMSQNPDAVSKASVLLKDAPRRRLIEQLETATHPTAIAAREAVASRGIDKAADPARYEDELVAYAINHAIESGGRSWAPIRGLVSAARAKLKEFVGSDNLNLNDLAHYANATINALAESEAGINAPGVGREQASPDVAAMQAEAEQMAQDSGLATAQTMVEGTATRTAENVMLPVDLLQRIPGTIDESRGPGDGQYDRLLAAVETDGWRNEFPVDVRVNHRGEVYIVDGNTRVAVAAARGLESVPANVQWMNGAENVDSPLTPAVVEGTTEPEFEGRAQEAAEASSTKPHVANIPSPLATVAKDAFTVYGSIGENVGRLMQEANYSRDAIYQTAIHNYHRVGPAMEAAAAKALAGEQGSVQEKREKFNDMILDRMSKIAELPTENAKDKALARLVQQYPDLAPLVRAVHDINKMTDTIIESRFAYDTTSPLTNEEIDMYSYMHRNKYGYLTNVYAAFQGKDGKKYTEAVMNAGAVGMKALAEGKDVPPKLKRLYQVYDDALRFIMQSDVAVSDPEMLAAMDIGDVTALYDRWMPARMRAADVAQEFRNHNNGVLDTHSFKAFLEEEIAAHVGMLKDPDYRAEDGSTGSEILHKQANAVMRSLLEGESVPGPAARYAKPRGIDTTILEHRAKLPDAIANLYGQIRDVPSLINATLTRQGELASRLDFFNKLATEGYGDAVVNAADRHLRGNENFTQLLSGPSFGRLNGMYTTPEMAKRLAEYGSMFTDLVDTIAVAGVNPTLARRWMAHKFGEAWTTGAGLQKAMKIITRPDYHLLNLAGSFSAPVLAGGVKPAHLLTGMKVALEHVALQIDPKGRVIGPELSAAHQLALQTGAFDNAVTQELRRAPRKLVNRLLDEMTAVDTVGGMMSLLKKAATWTNDRGWQTLVESYTMMDTWVKLPVLLERMDYLESYHRANGDTVSREELTRQAARYMRDATISMDNVPGLAKFAERTGMTFYLPYFASVFRVLHKSNVHIVDSLEMAVNAKTPEAKRIAIVDAGRKLGGVATVWAVAAQGLKWVAEMGMDDDDREQMERDRALMYDEGKYGDLRYVGTNDEGHRQYFLASRTDQFGPAFDLVRTLQRADSVEEGLTQLATGTWDLLVANRLFGATLEHVARGGKNTQLERAFPRATTWFKDRARAVGGETGREIMDYLITVGDLSSPAGIVNYFDPRNKTPEEVEDNAAAIISSMAAVTGHRLLTVNPEVVLRGKARELKEHRKDANSRIRESIQNLGPKAGFEAFVREAKKERALTEELADMYYSRLDSGMSRQEVEEWMELDAVSIRNIRNMAFTSENDRWIKEWSGLLSDQSINNPPEFRDMPDEDKAAAQEKWRAQAFEVNKMINAMNIKEKR